MLDLEMNKAEDKEVFSFNFKHVNIDNIFTENEIKEIRSNIAKKFIEEVNNGAIDPQTAQPFKANEKKFIAIHDRLANHYEDFYVYAYEFEPGFFEYIRSLFHKDNEDMKFKKFWLQ